MYSKLVVLVILAMVSVGLTGCGDYIPPGYVGILVDHYGSQKGVQDFPVQTGRVWVNPATQTLYQFPIFMQNVVWCKNTNEGKATDESFTFSSSDGASINVDVSMSYSIDAAKVPQIFCDLHQDVDQITNVYLRSKVRDAFVRHAATMKVADIYGAGTDTLLKAVKSDLQDQLKPRGFEIDMVTFTNKPRLDKTVQDSINAVLQQNNSALQAEAKVKEAQAIADQNVATAKGDAESQQVRAQGEANSILIKAKAQAQANEELAKSFTPAVIQYQNSKTWDGHLPQVTGNAVPWFNINTK